MLKINLQSLLRPKIFWPSTSIIILLIISTTLYILKEKEKSLRITKELELSRTVGAKRAVENSLIEAKEKIMAKDEQTKLTLDKLRREIRTRKAAEAVISALEGKEVLETEMEEITATAKDALEPEKIVTKPTFGLAKDPGLKRVEISQPFLRTAKSTEIPKDRGKRIGSMLFWLIGLSLTSGLGFLIWWLGLRYIVRREKITDSEITKLKTELQEKNKLIEQQEIIHKAVEETSLQKEKEYRQVKLELEEKEKLLGQYEEVKDSYESLKEVLIKRGEVKELTTPQEKGKLWVPGKSPERRRPPRLDLSRDYNRTIILRIESPDKSNPSTSSFDKLRTNPERSRMGSLRISPEQSRRAKSIKSFANNISLGGLCFETRKDFEESQMVNLRLFFFGDKVPMMRIQAQVIWKKSEPPVNRHGVAFTKLEEKDKTELKRYIESKIEKG